MSVEKLRNIAIIAHVDHGKTTLVDKLLQQSGTLAERGPKVERVMDSNALERERGITIKAQTASLVFRNTSDGLDYLLNLIDTPGHVDFSYEASTGNLLYLLCLLAFLLPHVLFMSGLPMWWLYSHPEVAAKPSWQQ